LDIIDRAYAIAQSTPKGPVYLSLPREVLCETCATDGLEHASIMQPATAAAPPQAVQQAAQLLAVAKSPVIVAQRGAGSAEGFAVLGKLASDWGIPVVQYWAVQLAIPTDHPMAVGSDPKPWLVDADVVLVIDSLAPWSPQVHALRDGCKVIQLGPDPLDQRVPVRNFRCDLALTGETADTLLALADAMRPLLPKDLETRDFRRARVSDAAHNARKNIRSKAGACHGDTMSKAFVSLCLSDAIAGRKATVLSELGCPLDPLILREHGSWLQEPHSGGLGWSFPAGLGLQLADPDRLVVATMGDGSYMFANPVACHQIAESLGLPLLVLILNNAEWGAVRASVLDIYPRGHAAKSNVMPLTSLKPSPDFVRIAEASRAFAQRVEKADALPAALQRAIGHVTKERTQALIDIRVAG
jgi:acetolactate synthase-1/2/3 large subunit